MKTKEAQSQKQEPDVLVESAGYTMFMVKPSTQAAKDWVKEHVTTESWQWIGDKFSVDQRCIENLVEGMQADGLVVQ